MTQQQHEVQSRRPANPRAMPVADLARLLSAVGGHTVTPEMVEADVVSGAPTNADGTIDLVHYCAWVCLKLRDDSG